MKVIVLDVEIGIFWLKTLVMCWLWPGLGYGKAKAVGLGPGFCTLEI